MEFGRSGWNSAEFCTCNLDLLERYCPGEDLLWLMRSATITQQDDNFASFHSQKWPHSRTSNEPIYCPSATIIYKDLLGFPMVYCPEEYVVSFMSYERLKLGNIDEIKFTGICRLKFM